MGQIVDYINKVKIFDGGMGSELERLSISYETVEDLNIDNPEIIQNIHMSYKNSDFITTNTFGLNKFKYKGKYGIKEVAIKAVENAKITNKLVFFDIGPTGHLMQPLGNLSFDDAYEGFKEVVIASKDLVDGYIIETFSDLLEIKAAILAVKENSDKPVFATMTFDEKGRTLTGTSPEIMVNTLEGLNVDVLGVNCSLGPKDLVSIVTRICNCSHIPVIVQPNRGIPKYFNGKASYDVSKEEFSYYCNEFLKLGVNIIGGCCGTNPEFIDEISKYRNLDVIKRNNQYKTLANSGSVICDIENVVICGERLNPTGKSKLKDAIINKNYDYIINEAINQKESGAKILDVNVGLPLIDEEVVLNEVVQKVAEFVDVPLQIDSTNPKAIENAVRHYCGIPIINSVNGSVESMKNIFGIAKKYGALVIALTLDENGIPKTSNERLEVAHKIIDVAKEYGIRKERIIVDTLVLSASSNQNMVKETVDAIEKIRSIGIKTCLGVSNVSFGLPCRQVLNRNFLMMALTKGLNMPIINPLDKEMIATIKSYEVIMNIDRDCEKYIEYFGSQNANVNVKEIETVKSVSEIIKKGLKGYVEESVVKELATYSNPFDFINNVLIKSLNEVGNLYEKGKIYLPQLISCSETAKIAFNIVLDKIPRSLVEKGNVVLGTVKGDVHDIGKNIIKVVLQSYGYNVIDLGKDVDYDNFVDACKKYNPVAVGLSALMTTTIDNMKKTIEVLKENNIKTKIVVGGAIVNHEIAKAIGADYYGENALDFIDILNK